MRNALPFYDAGFTTLISVVPPGGAVSPNSTLSQEDAGKVPGRLNYQGQYVGYDWMKHQPTRETVAEWVAHGNNIGFGAWDFPAIDVDVTHREAAEAVVAELQKLFGPSLVRTGRAPKALLVFRCSEPLRSFDVRYTRTHPLLGTQESHLVQFLGQGRQYVMDGVHPVTRQPYTIVDPKRALSLVGPQALPELTIERVSQAFDAIAAAMARFGYTASTDAHARLTAEDVPQDDLLAPNIEALAALVAELPNTLPDRHEYVAVGYAVKGASQNDPTAGLDIFQEWCSRWDQGSNDPATVARDWEKMAPPYRAGYEWLLDQGKSWGVDTSGHRFGDAEAPPEGGVPGDAEAPPEGGTASGGSPSPELAGQWSDVDLAERFAKAFDGDIMCVAETQEWYRWGGASWRPMPKSELQGEIIRFLKRETSKVMMLVDSSTKRAEIAQRLGGKRVIDNIKSLLTYWATISVSAMDLDSDPDVLNTPAGPYDLTTGKALPMEAGARCIKSTGVAPALSVQCPRWLQFLEESMQGDAEAIQHLKRLAGYSLTGRTNSQKFPFFIGAGGNGKSLYISVLSAALGTYHKEVTPVLFQADKRAGFNADYTLAQLPGIRLVTTSETKRDSTWDEQRIKQFTGGDTITARPIYGDPITFSTNATLIIVGNHAPDLDSVGKAIQRRMYLVPWDNQPVSPDENLIDKLLAELPGILAWCMEGAIEWYAHGLLPLPAAFNQETEDYFDEQDYIGRWLRECVVVEADAETLVANAELMDSYNHWRVVNDAPFLSARSLGKLLSGKLKSIGAKKARTNAVRGWRKLKLLPTPQPNTPSNVLPFKGVAPPGD